MLMRVVAVMLLLSAGIAAEAMSYSYQPTKEKARIKLSEFKTATPFGSDPNAYLERM